MLTRPMTASDRPLIENLCAPTPHGDIFLLANLDQLGGDGSMVQYWGQFDANTLTAVLMRYHVLWYVHVGPGADLGELAKTIRDQGQPRIVLNEGGVDAPRLAPLLAGYRTELRLSGRLRRLSAEEAMAVNRHPSTERPGAPTARRATQEDVDRLAAFYARGPEDVRRGADSLRRSIGGGRRTFLSERGNDVAACALTTAELPTEAMVGGLYAEREAERESGLREAVSELVRSLAADGKSACVVTRDHWIDRVLDQLNFETLGPWWMLHMSPA